MNTEEINRETDEKYMRRCLELAVNGRQNAKPNPMVGAVIVSSDGRIKATTCAVVSDMLRSTLSLP